MANETKKLTGKEHKVKRIADAMLQEMIDSAANGQFHGGCKLTHIAEMVKLAHQIRSLKEAENEA